MIKGKESFLVLFSKKERLPRVTLRIAMALLEQAVLF
jgi:hypothetical protein